MKVSPHQNAKGFQGPFPMRPADASQCEIQRSFGFDFVAMSSSVITMDWVIHNVLIDVIRYLMLFEAVDNQNSWLAMGLAVFTFTTSLCYTIPPLARPWVIREAWARRSLIIREHIFTEKADHYQPSINELVSYQISSLTIYDLQRFAILLNIVLPLLSLSLFLWFFQRSQHPPRMALILCIGSSFSVANPAVGAR